MHVGTSSAHKSAREPRNVIALTRQTGQRGRISIRPCACTCVMRANLAVLQALSRIWSAWQQEHTKLACPGGRLRPKMKASFLRDAAFHAERKPSSSWELLVAWIANRHLF